MAGLGHDYTDFMLRRTIALALLAAAAVLPASAANTAYDRAASMAAGETTLGRGYDGANAAGAVKASANGTVNAAGLVTAGSPHSSLSRPSLTASAVPTPNRGFMGGDSPFRRAAFGFTGAVAGAAVGGALGGPVGALFGAILGYGIALMLSKMLG